MLATVLKKSALFPGVLAGFIMFPPAAPGLQAAAYHLDCVGGDDQADGRSPAGAWRTLGRVNEQEFAPGDSILLRRGTSCIGSLTPKGSGKEGSPIRIGAYGTGPLPVISAGNAEAAVKLFDQEYWEIENLETSGGNPYGIFIGGAPAARTLRHFYLRNLVVHDVSGEVKRKASGLVVVAAPEGVTFSDIVVDGVTAYNTTQWAGIYISGSGARTRNVVVRNSIVHHVYGDGIVLFSAENGTIEKSAAWLTGLQHSQTIGTPNGIWTWTCRNCTVQNTEGFWIDSPGVDGGVYDIDWGNDDNIVQYNYGHDAQGYCVAIFGAGKRPTTNSVVRYNVCANNGRSPKLAHRQGDLYFLTWDGGTLDGVLVHNNSFIWNQPGDTPLVNIAGAEFGGSRPNRIVNNLFYSTVPSMISAGTKVAFQRNLYSHPGDARPKWLYGGRELAGHGAYHAAVPDDLFGDPGIDWLLSPLPGSPLAEAGLRLPDTGQRDAFGSALPPNEAPAIGAVQLRPARPSSGKAPSTLPRRKDRWLLLLMAGKAEAESRSQLVFIQTALAQYGGRSLDAAVAADAGANLQYDWNFGAVRRIASSAFAGALLLISPDGKIARRWDGFAAPAELGLTLKHFLGPAGGNPGLEPGR